MKVVSMSTQIVLGFPRNVQQVVYRSIHAAIKVAAAADLVVILGFQSLHRFGGYVHGADLLV